MYRRICDWQGMISTLICWFDYQNQAFQACILKYHWFQGFHRVSDPYHVGVRHSACTVPKCGFVIRYQTQNTSNLEQHYIRGGLDHKELAGRLTVMHQMERGVHLGAASDDNICCHLTTRCLAYWTLLLDDNICCHLTTRCLAYWTLRDNALSRVLKAPAYDSTLLMQVAQYPTCNLVMPQLYQMSLACLICE
jgi:hypothetical protein